MQKLVSFQITDKGFLPLSIHIDDKTIPVPENLSPVSAFGAVHDVVEHYDNDYSFEGELKAVGMSLHLRGFDIWALAQAMQFFNKECGLVSHDIKPCNENLMILSRYIDFQHFYRENLREAYYNFLTNKRYFLHWVARGYREASQSYDLALFYRKEELRVNFNNAREKLNNLRCAAMEFDIRGNVSYKSNSVSVLFDTDTLEIAI